MFMRESGKERDSGRERDRQREREREKERERKIGRELGVQKKGRGESRRQLDAKDRKRQKERERKLKNRIAYIGLLISQKVRSSLIHGFEGPTPKSKGSQSTKVSVQSKRPEIKQFLCGDIHNPYIQCIMFVSPTYFLWRV